MYVDQRLTPFILFSNKLNSAKRPQTVQKDLKCILGNEMLG